MSNQVYANMMEVSCKSGSGKTICAFPDVCFTPPQTPATPPGVPIPYPNTGMASDTTDGSSTVTISGKEVMLKNKSCFKKSSGDEAGSAPKKGVVTSKNTGKVYFNAWSMDVKIEGENVVRHLDITTHNHASTPGNSPPMPHTDAMQPAPPAGAACPIGSSCSVGSPVNPVLGVKVLAGTEDLDFTVPGPLPLVWQRYYLSSNSSIGWFGRGWSSPLELRLEAVPDATGSQVEQIEYVDYFGRRTVFDPLEPGGSQFSPNDKLELSRTAQGQYQLTGPDGLTFWFTDRRDVVYRVAAVTDRNGNATHVDYRDAAAGVMYVECSGRQRLVLTFQNDRLVSIVELRGADGGQRVPLTRYHFTDAGDVREVFNRANEIVREFDYTADRLMRRHVHARAFVGEYEYERIGTDSKVTRHWDNVGRSWTFTYRDDHTAVTDQDGRTVLHHFDRNKRLIGVTDALGQVSRIGLDRHGNVRALIDPAGHVTETLFDDSGNPIEVRQPDGAVIRMEFDPKLRLPVAVTDALGRTTLLKYDDRGNLVSEVDPAGAETRYFNDERGQAAIVINAIGGVTRSSYNDQGQLTRFVDCSQNVTQYTYDANGWLVGTTDALGQHTRLDYDAAGRVIRVTLADGSHESYEDDIAGRLVAFTDALQQRTEYRYSPDGLLTQRVDAAGHSVAYRYDTSRRLIELINENGASYRFTRDALGRAVDETRFDGTRVRWTYDAANQPIETSEEPGTPAEIVFKYTRDAIGRMLVRESEGNRAVFEYDAAGQLVLARTERPAVEVKIAYDEAGRRISESVATDERSFAIRHSYDPLGNRLTTRLPDGKELGTTYYGCGNALQISLGGDPVTAFERDALHREVSRTQGALITTRDYDPAGRLQSQKTAVARIPVGQTREIDRQFHYDAAGRLISTEERNRRLTYGYDAIDQLTRFNEERFAFDPAHNLLPPNVPDAIVADNRVRTSEDGRYRYDAHGRVIEKRVGNDAVVLLTWNDDHRLAASTIVDIRGSRSTSYLYDAFGRRIAKRDPDGTTWFVWDDDALLQEYRAADERTFLYEPDTFVPLAHAFTTRAPGKPSSTTIEYFHCDQVGLPREITDSAGQITWEGLYSGWGRLRNERIESATSRNALRYQGEYFDEETGLHYSLMRYYDPDIARFISKDPIGLWGGLNEYQYSPNPVLWIDPWGLTGAYIFTDGTTWYVGKGPEDRMKASQRQRLGTACGPATISENISCPGDNEMGFMVEHLLMQATGAGGAGSSAANAIGLSSPGKKKYNAASKARKKAAEAKAKKMLKDFKAKGGGCP